MKIYFLSFLVFFSFFACGQVSEKKPRCERKAFDLTVHSLIAHSVALIDVREVQQGQQNYILLDAREKKEYDVSHIDGAQHIGYEQFVEESVKNLAKDANIVVYCSVGYRSEKVGEKLQKIGFTNVKNMHGSIFEWVNRGYEVVDNQQQKTKKVHAYNKIWSNWISNKNIQKVF